MAGALEADHARVLEMPRAAVLLRVRGPALLAVHQERRAGDAAPQLLDLLHLHVAGRPDAHVIVELPAEGAVLVLIDAVLGEMARLLGREVLVGRLHAAERLLDRSVAARQAAREGVLQGDPL